MEWMQSEPFAIRITHSALITLYDPLPTIVAAQEYKLQTVACPVFRFALSDEIEIDFSPGVFLQILSRVSAMKWVFRVFKLFFDAEKTRYEIVHLKERTFRVVQEGGELIVEADMFEFHVSNRAIGVQGLRFDPVDGLILVPHPGRLSRSGSLLRLD
jgi:hypothetical protein